MIHVQNVFGESTFFKSSDDMEYLGFREHKNDKIDCYCLNIFSADRCIQKVPKNTLILYKILRLKQHYVQTYKIMQHICMIKHTQLRNVVVLLLIRERTAPVEAVKK